MGVSGRRYYSPNQGRFFGRDPIEESGGLKLYSFCGNNSINRWDYLGMADDIVKMAPFVVEGTKIIDDDLVLYADGGGGSFVPDFGGGGVIDSLDIGKTSKGFPVEGDHVNDLDSLWAEGLFRSG